MAPLTLIAVVGAGTMGAGIAQVAARAGLLVRLLDAVPGAAERGLQRARADLDRLVERGRMAASERDAALERLSAAARSGDLAGCEALIEAVPEDLDLKRSVFREVDEVLPDALLATNTSTLSVSAIAAAIRDPSRLVGMHFFNPAPLMPLVEVVAGDATSRDAVGAAEALARQLGKRPLVVRDTPGFIVNRVARPYYGEALRILADGGEAATIDQVMRGAGFRMGPFELMDLIGLDVNLAATKSVYDSFFHEPRYRPHSIQQKMVDSGRLGRKTGRGFYSYREEES
jgi:3-hydroxybutyryl-CoA dehydrogenase